MNAIKRGLTKQEAAEYCGCPASMLMVKNRPAQASGEVK